MYTLPLELIDLICDKLPLKILINNGDFILPELNMKKVKKYWRYNDIYKLIADNDINGVKYLIAKNDGENYSKDDLKDIAVIICEYGHLEILKYLLEFLGGKLLKNNKLKLLLTSIKNGYLDMVKYLVNIIVENGNTWDSLNYFIIYNEYKPITRAVKYKHLDILKYLVEKGGSTENVKACEERIIELAIYNDDIDTLKYLVSQGVNIRFKDDYALEWACLCGQLGIVKYLVSLGLDIKKKYREILWKIKRSPYHYVYIEKYLESFDTTSNVINIYFIQ